MYNNNPVKNAKYPFNGPNEFESGMIWDSCNQDRIANIIPKAEINSQISFFNFMVLTKLVLKI